MSRIDRVWIGLVAATLATFFVGESGAAAAAVWPMLLVFGLVIAKGLAVALEFMGLASAPALWRRIVVGWLFGVVALLLLAWWLARHLAGG
ncbi:hypothetical protein CLD22_12950 [Rubrivivax gelatinosus]|nr:hypothetical protein [Rubrivivax gelatinosus]